MKIVRVVGVNGVYLVGEVAAVVGDITMRRLANACLLPDGTTVPFGAMKYVQGTVTGQTVNIDVSATSLASVQDGGDYDTVVPALMSLIPVADKQAKASALMPFLTKMFSGQ